MQGAITNIDNLREWFFNNNRPFFGLRYYNPGKAGDMILRNEVESDISAAWMKLSTEVLSQAAAGRARLQVIVYAPGKTANNYDALTNVDMQAGGLSSMPQVSGINGPQPGFIGKEEVEEMKIALRKEWDQEQRISDLEAQINAPNDWTEKLISGIEKISETPLGMALIAKITGLPIAPPVMGAPQSDEAEEVDNFENDIATTASILGVSDTELAAKLRRMVEASPDIARQILNQ